MNNRLAEVHVYNRKDVNVVIDWVVTLPEELKGSSAGDIRDFFSNTHDFLVNRYGGLKNVVCSEIHMDESAPHLHFGFIPVVYDETREQERVQANKVIDRKELKVFHTDLHNNLKISLMISFTMSLFLAINSRFFIGMFTDNEAILQLASTILWIDVVLEIGRTFNLVLILSARGAGDVRFPMIIAIIVMWIVGLGTGITLATVFNMQLVGIWIGLTCDEWVRGLLMMLRWRGEKWKQFKMV